MASQSFEESLWIVDPKEEDNMLYTEFRGKIYLVTHNTLTLKLYVFDETVPSWNLVLEQEFKVNVHYLKSCSLSTTLAIVVDGIRDNDKHYIDFIYNFDPDSKTLTHFKNGETMDVYLSAPDYLHI